MRSKVTTAPAQEPVTISEIKSSLRITNTQEDGLLNQFIEDARTFVELKTGRKLITQTVTAYYDGFDGRGGRDQWWSGHRMGAITEVYGGQELRLEFSPTQSITSLSTVAEDNSETVISSSEYYLDNYDNDMASYLRSDNGISNGTRSHNSVKVVYVAGYGDNPVDVPSALRRAVIAMVGKLYATRGDCSAEQCADECGAMRMLEPYVLETVR